MIKPKTGQMQQEEETVDETVKQGFNWPVIVCELDKDYCEVLEIVSSIFLTGRCTATVTEGRAVEIQNRHWVPKQEDRNTWRFAMDK